MDMPDRHTNVTSPRPRNAYAQQQLSLGGDKVPPEASPFSLAKHTQDQLGSGVAGELLPDSCVFGLHQVVPSLVARRLENFPPKVQLVLRHSGNLVIFPTVGAEQPAETGTWRLEQGPNPMVSNLLLLPSD